jgi:hypothetical protein
MLSHRQNSHPSNSWKHTSRREAGSREHIDNFKNVPVLRTVWLWGPLNLLYKGTGASFPGVKRPGREADHSPPTSAEVKKIWIYTSIPPYAFMA